ncbi:C-C motif chemokine 21 [Labeo rohita]|uniref:C-C motif chemokine 21 n=1 Tax=Labeo rohita TaxID=84645 RepID=A0ABQ8MYF5_LABRO|nr:C-C motif chemokine 21 [Labeo rohita]
MTRTSVTVIVLLVAALSVLCKDASALSCCRKYTRGKIPMSIIRGYSIQTIKRNCHIDAVMFLKKRTNQKMHPFLTDSTQKEGRNICTDPSKPWVMDNIQELK